LANNLLSFDDKNGIELYDLETN